MLTSFLPSETSTNFDRKQKANLQTSTLYYLSAFVDIKELNIKPNTDKITSKIVVKVLPCKRVFSSFHRNPLVKNILSNMNEDNLREPKQNPFSQSTMYISSEASLLKVKTRL